MCAIFVYSKLPMQETKKITHIPTRNRNAFSYQTSLPRPISAKVYRSPKPISLRFTGIQKPRPASRSSIDKSRNSSFKIRADVRRASDQRTITPWRIFTSGRMRATSYGWIYIFVGCTSNHAFLPSVFSPRSRITRITRARGLSRFDCIEA